MVIVTARTLLVLILILMAGVAVGSSLTNVAVETAVQQSVEYKQMMSEPDRK